MGIDALAFRRIMGYFATGVTVVTTCVNGRLHGMTANAVASVSLEPLLLLVCVDRRSNAHAELSAARGFAVNILAAEQRELARSFAEREEPQAGSLRGVPFTLGAHGAPLLDGCLAHVECALEQHFDGGDHSIFVGRALDGAVARDARPLLFYRGSYWAPEVGD